MDKLHLIAAALLEKETLEGKEIEHLLKEGTMPEKKASDDEQDETLVAPLTPVPAEEAAVAPETVAQPEADAEAKPAYTAPDKP